MNKKKEFNVDIHWDYACSVTVEAESDRKAREIVEQMIQNGEFDRSRLEPTDDYDLDTNWQPEPVIEASDETDWNAVFLRYFRECYFFWLGEIGKDQYVKAYLTAFDDVAELKCHPYRAHISLDYEKWNEWLERYDKAATELVAAEANGKLDNVRYCAECGFPMIEGYYLADEFACCEECCLEAYHGDREQMEEDLSHAEEPDSECYWTKWDSVLYAFD